MEDQLWMNMDVPCALQKESAERKHYQAELTSVIIENVSNTKQKIKDPNINF